LASSPWTVASGSVLAKFSTMKQSSGYAADYSYVQYEMQKGGHFDIFECP